MNAFSMQADSPSIRLIIAQHASLTVPVEHLADGDDLYTYGLSSLATVELMLAIEDAYDIELPERLLVRSTFESIDAISEAVTGILASTRVHGSGPSDSLRSPLDPAL
jgi:acyl carrier protein